MCIEWYVVVACTPCYPVDSYIIIGNKQLLATIVFKLIISYIQQCRVDFLENNTAPKFTYLLISYYLVIFFTWSGCSFSYKKKKKKSGCSSHHATWTNRHILHNTYTRQHVLTILLLYIKTVVYTQTTS